MTLCRKACHKIEVLKITKVIIQIERLPRNSHLTHMSSSLCQSAWCCAVVISQFPYYDTPLPTAQCLILLLQITEPGFT